MDRQQLSQDLATHLSAAELAALAGKLGVEATSLGGKSQADKAKSLIGKAERNGRLPELVYWLVQAKPQLQPTYQSYLAAQSGPKDARLAWLDSLAAGEGPAIEEPPTMRWDSGVHPRDEAGG